MRNGHDTSRLQGFSDGVFALSATLLVVTLGEVPSNYDELVGAVARFPAFALAFAALVSVWNGHREFFARYPIADGWTVAINSVLLFIVLLYVYPLKLLSEVVAESLLGTGPAALASMGVEQIRGLYLIFGTAIVAVLTLLAALHLRAWSLRRELALDELGRYELRQEIVVYAALVLVGVLSLLTAGFGVGLRWGLPVWQLLLLSPLVAACERLLTAGRRRQLRAVRDSETEHGHRTVTAAVQEYADGQVRQSTQQL
jgi:uncharacterized membrane protein